MDKNLRSSTMLIVVAALGYFVDIYDLIVFNVVKKESLEALGYGGELFKKYELMLFNWQMFGMLLGGVLWGILGDKRGRVSVLFGSIVLYSIANISNAFVTDIYGYSLFRFMAGLGLAGELGAGITLVAETMHREKRGYGTMIIVTFGALGAVAASLVGNTFGWKMTYIIGGSLGLLLLLLRASAFESGMFEQMKQHQSLQKGNFLQLLSPPQRFLKYIRCILIGLPIWYVIGVLIALSNRFAEAKGMQGITVGSSVMYAYIGLSAGDLLSGLLSQWFRSRKKIIIGYLLATVLLVLFFLYMGEVSHSFFYFLCFLLGTATGYWALFVTNAAEQFGTNLRSTVTNTVPNFVRGSVIPITLTFDALSKQSDLNTAALIVGGVCLALAWISTMQIDETFAKDLDYWEH